MLYSTQVSLHTLWFPSGKCFLFNPYLSLRSQLQSFAQGTFPQYPCLRLPPFYKCQSTTAIFLAFISVGDYRFLARLLDDHFSPPLEWALYKIKDCVLFCLPTQYRVDMQENRNEWRLCTVYAFSSLKCLALFPVLLHSLPLLERLSSQLSAISKYYFQATSSLALRSLLFHPLLLRNAALQPSLHSADLRLHAQYLCSLLDETTSYLSSSLLWPPYLTWCLLPSWYSLNIYGKKKKQTHKGNLHTEYWQLNLS